MVCLNRLYSTNFTWPILEYIFPYLQTFCLLQYYVIGKIIFLFGLIIRTLNMKLGEIVVLDR